MIYNKEKIIKIAKMCHEVNRVYCESLNDLSQKPWDKCSQWQKESAINGVLYHLENEVTPEESHINWFNYKLNSGWKYGKLKDEVLKTHPCMVSYKELPEEQKIKDKLFISIVNILK